jgi:hypothetical protein
LSGSDIGKKAEIKAFSHQRIFGNFRFVFLTGFFQNPPIFSERVIDVPHQIIGVGIEFIVVRIAAQVRTKLFIRPADDLFSAF